MVRCYEDFAIGEVDEAGPVVVTAEAITAFAAQFDPEPRWCPARHTRFAPRRPHLPDKQRRRARPARICDA
jgi:hypothetical protein